MAKSDLIARIPPSEITWVTYFDSDKNVRYVITSNELRQQYSLYEVVDSRFKRLGKAGTPTELEKKYIKM